MKAATGNYYNLFTEVGYDNYGLKGRIDIMIIFIESFDFSEDIIDSLDLYLEGKLRDLALRNPDAGKGDIETEVALVLDTLEYEYERIIVRKDWV